MMLALRGKRGRTPIVKTQRLGCRQVPSACHRDPTVGMSSGKSGRSFTAKAQRLCSQTARPTCSDGSRHVLDIPED